MNRGIDMRIFEIILNQYVKALERCEKEKSPKALDYWKMRTYHDAICYMSTNYEYMLFESKYREREIAVINKIFCTK